MSRFLCIAVLAVCLLPSLAQAEITRYPFTAVITHSNDGGVYGPIGIGSIVTGFFELDSQADFYQGDLDEGAALWLQTADIRVAVGTFDMTWTVLNIIRVVNETVAPDPLDISLFGPSGEEQPYWPLYDWDLKLVGTPDLHSSAFVPDPLNLAELVLNQSTLTFSYDEGPSFVATLTSIVPEPASAGVMAFAALGLLGRRRRNWFNPQPA